VIFHFDQGELEDAVMQRGSTNVFKELRLFVQDASARISRSDASSVQEQGNTSEDPRQPATTPHKRS